MVKIFEILRIILLCLGFALAYSAYFAHQNLLALDWLVALVVIPITGLTAIQAVFFSATASEVLGRELGSGYQIQSGLNNAATAIVAILVLALHWPAAAKLVVLFVTLIFFGLSASYHGYEYFFAKRQKQLHLMRIIMTPILWIASAPIIIASLNLLK
jgi:hypothetical protein